MNLGRKNGKVKIKTDGGLRAVSCGCCATGCYFNGYIQKTDGTYNKYKYLKLSISGNDHVIDGCDFSETRDEESSYSLWLEVERIPNPNPIIQCDNMCRNAQGSYTWRGNYVGDPGTYDLFYYTVSNCMQSEERYFYTPEGSQFLGSYPPYPIPEWRFRNWYFVSDFANVPEAVVTITSDTEAQVTLIYTKTFEYQLGDEECSTWVNSNITLTYKLSNERIT